MKKHRQKAFLNAFRATASLSKAADAAKIVRSLHYRWLEDPSYAHQFKLAREDAAQTLEDEAVRRAHEGILNPHFYKGKAVGVIREYSDGLLTFLLKGLKPERYRDRSTIEHSGPDGGPISLEERSLARLTDDELTSLLAIASKLDAPGHHPGGSEQAQS